jgi:hypothetical protein
VTTARMKLYVVFLTFYSGRESTLTKKDARERDPHQRKNKHSHLQLSTSPCIVSILMSFYFRIAPHKSNRIKNTSKPPAREQKARKIKSTMKVPSRPSISFSSLPATIAATVVVVLFMVITPTLASSSNNNAHVCDELGQECRHGRVKTHGASWLLFNSSSIVNQAVVAAVTVVPHTNKIMTEDDIHTVTRAAVGGDGSTTTTSPMYQAVQSLDHYLQNPTWHLQNNIQLDQKSSDVLLSSSDTNNDLLWALDDLEEQFFADDSTATNEFYALGGWPLLASLVSPLVHSYNSNRTNDINETETATDMVDKILAIRAAAAAVLGAAVHTMDDGPLSEFHSAGVLEEIIIIVDDDDDSTNSRRATTNSITTTTTTTTTTTPLDLLAQALVEISHTTPARVRVPPGSKSLADESTLYFQEHLAEEAIRTLELFLRRNRPAQIHLVTSSTSSIMELKSLGPLVAKWAQEAAATAACTISTNVPMSRHSIEMTRSLLSLAYHLVQDIQDWNENANVNDDDDDDTAAVMIAMEAFSTNDWCDAALHAATLTPSSDFKRLVFQHPNHGLAIPRHAGTTLLQ